MALKSFIRLALGRYLFYICGCDPDSDPDFFIYLFVHFLTRQILLQKNIQTKIRFVPFDPGNLHYKTFDNCKMEQHASKIVNNEALSTTR
jgi:hypothetical protein